MKKNAFPVVSAFGLNHGLPSVNPTGSSPSIAALFLSALRIHRFRSQSPPSFARLTKPRLPPKINRFLSREVLPRVLPVTNILSQDDPEVWSAIEAEEERQADGLEMIASENYTSAAVQQAVGSVLTNKYAEGYPGRRYYGGCQHVDVVEDLARNRLKQLFGAEHVNVQPHSGSQANMAVYVATINPGDTVLGLDLAHGGHLTHGMDLNISGKLYKFFRYGVTRDTNRIDFDQVAKLARDHKPKMIVAGASAYPREIPHEKFAEIAREVGAKLFVDMAHYAGLVAAGLHNNPVPVADFVTSTTHKTLRGPRGGITMCKADYAKDIDRTVFPGIQERRRRWSASRDYVDTMAARLPFLASIPTGRRRACASRSGCSIRKRTCRSASRCGKRSTCGRRSTTTRSMARRCSRDWDSGPSATPGS